ncbi:MAG: transcriptional repressor LexA [Planctomycetes bacterium]|nr:transcriptional repressor LexA [Planctomycetota bacterium]
MKAYTKKQRAILEFIAAYQASHSVSPTLEEIGTEFGVHRVTIFQHVSALERRGAIRRGTQLARGLEILDADFLPQHPVQIVGTIAAGRPLAAIETPEALDIDEYVPQDGDHYALRVRGDSMVEDGICDGDLVICRKATGARNGQVVVAIVGDEEATLKRFYKLANGRVRLEPANARLRPVVVEKCEVRGVVVSVIRRV